MSEIVGHAAFALALYGAAYVGAGLVGLESFRFMSVTRSWPAWLAARLGVAFLVMWIAAAGDVPALNEGQFVIAFLGAFAAFWFLPELIEHAARTRGRGWFG